MDKVGSKLSTVYLILSTSLVLKDPKPPPKWSRTAFSHSDRHLLEHSPVSGLPLAHVNRDDIIAFSHGHTTIAGGCCPLPSADPYPSLDLKTRDT